MPRVSESRPLELDSSKGGSMESVRSGEQGGRGRAGDFRTDLIRPQPPLVAVVVVVAPAAEIRSGPRRESRYRVLDAHRPADPEEAQHCTREPPHHRPDVLKPPLLLLLRGAATRPAPKISIPSPPKFECTMSFVNTTTQLGSGRPRFEARRGRAGASRPPRPGAAGRVRARRRRRRARPGESVAGPGPRVRQHRQGPGAMGGGGGGGAMEEVRLPSLWTPLGMGAGAAGGVTPPRQQRARFGPLPAPPREETD